MSVCAAANVEASNNADAVLPRVEFHDGAEGPSWKPRYGMIPASGRILGT